MKINFLFFILLISSLNCFSQNTNTKSDVTDFSAFNNNLSGGWISSSHTLKNSNIEGSPYLFDSWDNNTQIYSKGRVYKIRQSNFNIKLNRFEAKISQDSVYAFNSKDLDKIVINNRIFNQFNGSDKTKKQFYEEVIDFGGKKLLKKHEIRIQEGIVNPMTQESVRPDEYIKSEDYFVFDGNATSEIKLNKKNVINLLYTEDKDLLKNFVKKHKLNLRDINDVIKLIQYYNSL